MSFRVLPCTLFTVQKFKLLIALSWTECERIVANNKLIFLWFSLRAWLKASKLKLVSYNIIVWKYFKYFSSVTILQRLQLLRCHRGVNQTYTTEWLYRYTWAENWKLVKLPEKEKVTTKRITTQSRGKWWTYPKAAHRGRSVDIGSPHSTTTTNTKMKGVSFDTSLCS